MSWVAVTEMFDWLLTRLTDSLGCFQQLRHGGCRVEVRSVM